MQSAIKYQGCGGDDSQDFDHGHEDREDVNLSHSQAIVFGIQRREMIVIGLLPAEALDGLDAVYGFGHAGIDLRHLDPQCAKNTPRPPGKPPRGPGHQG